jgi:radical SAM protein with 4Fe4S-binding SPASM domain
MFKPESFHFQWHITEKCNLKCKHCYSEQEFSKNELTTDELLALFDQYLEMISGWGLTRKAARVSISGGEPFERKDLFALLEKMSENRRKTRYSLMTNGTSINEEIAIRLKALGLESVQVSLEGTRETNDSIRGKGSFDRAMRGIKELQKQGIQVSISMTVSKANISEVPKMIDFCRTERIGLLGIRRLVPLGRGKELKGQMLEPEEVKRLYNYVFRHNLGAKGNAPFPEVTIGCEDGLLAQNMHYVPKGCSAAFLSLTILPNGDVFPCRRLPIKAGNVLEKSLKDIFYDSPELKELREIDKASKLCRECPFWIECRGGSKCASYGYFGDAFSPDPQCWRLFEKLQQAPEKAGTGKTTGAKK